MTNRESRARVRSRCHVANASVTAPVASMSRAKTSNSHKAPLNRSPARGTNASRTTAGRRSIVLSMVTVASDRLTGIPFERRKMRLLASSPPWTGSNQLRKVAMK